MLGSVPDSEVRAPRLGSRAWTCRFSHSMRPWIFRFKLVSTVHFLSECVVVAVASGERIGLSIISPLEVAIMKIDEHRSSLSSV